MAVLGDDVCLFGERGEGTWGMLGLKAKSFSVCWS